MNIPRRERPLAVTALAKAYDLQCPRFLAWIRDPDVHLPLKMEDTPAGRELSRHGIEHETRAVSRIAGGEPVIEPEYPKGDLATGTLVTQELMTQLIPFIGQAPLYSDLSSLPFPIHGLVDLFRLTPLKSRAMYQVIEIKSSRRIKTSQMLQASIYGRMVSHISGIEHFPAPVVVDGLFHEHSVPIAEFDPIVTEFLETEIPLWLEAGEDSFHRSSRCISCPFDEECRHDAFRRSHISLISGVSRGLAKRLTAIGADSPVQVETTDPELLRSVALEPGFVKRLQGQSDAIEKNRTIGVPTPPPLPATTVELFLDIEPDPTGPHPCRLGLLKRDNSIHRTAYRGRIMPVNGDETSAHVRAFIDLITRQIHRASSQSKSWLILYYGGPVAESLFELSELSGIKHHLIDELFSNAVDMKTLLRRIWYFPVERYSLAHVLAVCGMILPEECPGFVLHRQWRSLQDDQRSDVEESLIRHGERYCESLLSLWDWMKNTTAVSDEY